jgi:hypothetical protein
MKLPLSPAPIIAALLLAVPIAGTAQTRSIAANQFSSVANTEATASSHAYKPVVVRDDVSVAVLRQAIDGLGGLQAESRISSVVADGTSLQDGHSEVVRLETKDRAFRLTSGTHTFSTDGIAGWSSASDRVQALPRYVWTSTIMPLRIGNYLAEALSDSDFTVEQIPEKSDDATIAIRIRDERTAFSHVLSTRLWYFDRQSHMPVKAEFQERAINSSKFFIWTTVCFDGFEQTAGVLLPTKLTYSSAGLFLRVISLTSVQANLPLEQSRFVKPEGGSN